MHLFGILFFGLIAIFWLTYGLQVFFGAARLPWLKRYPPAHDADCPRLSLIFAARDEEEKLPSALSTLVEIDYPQLEIIAVDDRSQDATPRILDDFAVKHHRLRIVHVRNLPPGWLGKPHALHMGYAASNGEWLLFTDADVKFMPDTLRRAVRLARERRLEHLTLLCDVEMHGFWEKVLLTFFGMGFHLATNPHQVSNPNSRAYVGVGAFQMLKRTAYEVCGTHRRLAMEVVDDMKLGKLVKLAGFRSGVGVAQDAVSVRWHAGLGNLIRGVEKNFFAGAQYSGRLVAAQAMALVIFHVLPLAGLIFAHDWVRVLAAIGVLIPLCFHIGVDIVMRVSPVYCFTLPLGALLFTYMLLRSTVVTLLQGGIVWRDTFYPLKDLRRGSV
jgi:glycosyltransferase involved in cell wall biosynthesis